MVASNKKICSEQCNYVCPCCYENINVVFVDFSNVKCQRKTFICPQGDAECLYAPLSYSTNFITFPTRIRTPADLFTMRGPLSPYRRLAFDLKLISAKDPRTGEARVNRAYFAVRQVGRTARIVFHKLPIVTQDLPELIITVNLKF